MAPVSRCRTSVIPCWTVALPEMSLYAQVLVAPQSCNQGWVHVQGLEAELRSARLAEQRAEDGRAAAEERAGIADACARSAAGSIARVRGLLKPSTLNALGDPDPGVLLFDLRTIAHSTDV